MAEKEETKKAGSFNLKAQKEKSSKINKQKTFKGATGNTIYGGYYSEDYLTELQGQNAVALYDRMRRSDGQIKMVLNAIKNPIRSATFSHDAESDDPEMNKLAEYLNFNWFENPTFNFHQWLFETLTYLDYGFSIHEKWYQTVEHPEFGLVHILGDLGFRKQSTIEQWMIDKKRGLWGVRQLAFGDTTGKATIDEILPEETLVINTNEKEGDNYEGLSLLRPCYGSWLRKNLYLKLNGIGIEKASIGTPIGYYPKGTETEEDKDEFINMLASFAIHEKSYLVAPDGYKIEVVKIDFDSSKIMDAIRYEDTQMSKSILFQFFELGTNSNSGSFSLGSDLSDIALASIQFIGDMICRKADEISADLIEWNFGAVDKIPKMKCSGINAKAGEEFAKSVKDLKDAEILRPDPRLEQHVRRLYNLPKIDENRPEIPLPVEPEPPKEKEFSEYDRPLVRETHRAFQNNHSPYLAPTFDAEQQREETSQIQSIIFDKELFTVDMCQTWLIRNGFRANSIDENENGYRFGQKEVMDFRPDSFRTIALEKGVQAIVGNPVIQFQEPNQPKPRDKTIYEKPISLAGVNNDFENESKKLTRMVKAQLGVLSEKTLRAVEILLKKNPKDKTRAAVDFKMQTKAMQKYLLAQLASIVAVGSKQGKEELGKKTKGADLAEPSESFKRDIEFLPKHVRDALILQSKQQAETYANEIEKIVTFGISSGVESELTDKEIISNIEDGLDEYVEGAKVSAGARTMTSQAINRGRDGFFYKPENLKKIQAFQYSAILDERTTDICLSLDGKIMKPNDPDLPRLRPPSHHGCRSILIPITVNEKTPTLTGIDIDPTNESLKKEYKRRGKPSPDLAQIKKSRNL